MWADLGQAGQQCLQLCNLCLQWGQLSAQLAVLLVQLSHAVALLRARAPRRLPIVRLPAHMMQHLSIGLPHHCMLGKGYRTLIELPYKACTPLYMAFRFSQNCH
jgi:hypothetical protein